VGAWRRIYNLRAAEIKGKIRAVEGGDGFYTAVKRNPRQGSFFLHDFYNKRPAKADNTTFSEERLFDF
jgi:hypothetical protein